MTVRLEFHQGESKDGRKGSEHSHWYAYTAGNDGSGDTPLDAVMALAEQQEKELLR